MHNIRNLRRNVPTLVVLGLAASMSGVASAAEKPAKLEPIPGSDLKRVVLTPKAAQRLAIATVEVSEEPVLRWLMVEGKVEAAPTATDVASAAASPAQAVAAAARVRLLEDPNQILADPKKMQHSRLIVSLKEDDDGDDDDDDDADDVKQNQDKAKTDDKAKAKERPPVVVLPVGKARSARLPATPVRVAGVGGAAEVSAGAPGSMSQDYEVMKPDHDLRPGQRVYARILHPDSGKPQKVVPYSAVFYDTKGNTWTYTNPEPLVFIRHRVEVESIEGNRAVLSEGPAIGTKVVTAGAPELMGVEQKFGH